MSSQQLAHHGGVELFYDIRVCEETVCEGGFVLLEFVDAFFDGFLAEELVDEDRLVLAYAIGAVCRLRFGGRVPPRIVVDHCIGGGEVQAGAACFQGDEENGKLSGLELLDEFSPVF